MKVKVNDKVRVIAGKAKGTDTTITKISGERVFLAEGIIVKKHMKPTQTNPDGGILELAGSTHISNVQLLDGNAVTRVGYEFDTKGNKSRISRKTGKKIK